MGTAVLEVSGSDATRVKLPDVSSGELEIAFRQVESRQAEGGNQDG
ncbi:hypothetical protein KBX50_13125 [Micromonospora sp. C51]|nr:hypothetical protein [Micromonospora sp. C51]MBQ1049400.1 hypothetical protein [Micromonospora sp. C51]